MKVFLFGMLAILFSVSAKAADAPTAEKLDVDRLKQKYWDRNEDPDLRIVQNRMYAKKERVELGVYGGTISTDPFLTVKNLGVSLAYHFTESWALNALAWKSFTSNSSAYATLLSETNRIPNTNPVKGFYGGEIAWSPIYGKLSLVGKLIVHYDLHVSLGAGATTTSGGNFFTPLIGIGQQVYLSNHVALKLDYRYMTYSETFPAVTGASVSRTNSTDVITLGFSFFMFGPSPHPTKSGT